MDPWAAVGLIQSYIMLIITDECFDAHAESQFVIERQWQQRHHPTRSSIPPKSAAAATVAANPLLKENIKAQKKADGYPCYQAIHQEIKNETLLLYWVGVE